MSDSSQYDNDSDVQKRQEQAARQPEEQKADAGLAGMDTQSSYSPSTLAGAHLSEGDSKDSQSYPQSLLNNARLTGRGNEPVRIALMLQAQQDYGNRAVQRRQHQGATSGKITPVQRSPLSEQADKAYGGKQKNKEAVFDLLRKNPPGTKDEDLDKWLAANLAGDDLWLAKKIEEKGPEVMWDDADLKARSQKSKGGWVPEHGFVEGSIGESSGLVGAKANIEAFFFPGETDERALIIGGVHGSELSGIEVANKLKDSLIARYEKQKKLPHYTTIIVPELFPETAQLARDFRKRKQAELASKAGKGKPPPIDTEDYGEGREVEVPWTKPKKDREAMWKAAHPGDKMPAKKSLYPARQFPAKGKTVDDLVKAGGPIDETGARLKDDEGVDIPLMLETVALLRLIERFKPKRIASVHAHRFDDSKPATKGVDAPGIFVDPRGGFDESVDPAFPAKVKKAQAEAKKAQEALKKAQTALDKAKVGKDEAAIRAAQEKWDKAKKEADAHPYREATDITGLTKEGKADDALALAMAKEAKKGGARVPGSHLDESGPAVVHYAASAGHPEGRSLGDWGPEQGMTVITVEVEHQFESGGDAARSKELQAHADALQNVFLESK